VKAARIILAIVVPIIGAIVIEVLRPHHGADRVFVFVVAIAAAITMSLAFAGGEHYPPSVKQAIDQLQEVTPPSYSKTALGCLGPGVIVVLFVLLGLFLLVASICGGRF